MNLIENLEKLSGLCGVSGHEHPVREEILAQLEGLPGLTTTVDPLGNVIVQKKGAATPKNKLLLSAHMDEVGFVITRVEDSGLLRFATVGGIDNRVIVGKAVEVGDKRVYGVIGTKAVHHQEEAEREEPLAPDKLFIDIGAADRTEAEQHVTPGDFAVFHSRFRRFGDGRILGKAFDDRAGCAMLLELAKADLPYDCALAFTVQEETGCTGGVTAGYSVNPDIGVILETTTASDIAGVTPDKTVCKQGQGPVISFMDRGTVYDRDLFRLTLDVAREQGILCQIKQATAGGNESRSVQAARSGARVLGVSLPCRYLHSPSNMLKISDVEEMVKLVHALIPVLAEL